MSARLLFSAAAGVASAFFSQPALANDDWEVVLSEAAEPDSKSWEDPARIAFTIDTDGPDRFSAQVNLEAKRNLGEIMAGRDGKLGGYIRWNRESGGKDQQSNFEAGVALDITPNTTYLDRPRDVEGDPTDIANRRAGTTRWALSIGTGYARTAAYADLSAAPCTTTPAVPQCQTQHEESLRSSLALVPTGVWQEGGKAKGISYSIEPKLGLDHDLILNAPIEQATGLAKKGGYLSALAGIKFKLMPGFISPSWELAASAQLRQALSRSTLRRDEIEESAELFKLSATYFFITPSETSKWRAGLGLTYTKGGDPLTGKPDVSTIVVAFRLGQY